jgi:hypothetical protein
MAFLCGRRGALVVILLSGWVLWHDVAVYRSPARTRMAGPTYAVTAYATEADCQAEQRAAMAREELPRRGPLTERLSDGIMVWDPDRQHYTTLRYRCVPAADANVAPFQ